MSPRLRAHRDAILFVGINVTIAASVLGALALAASLAGCQSVGTKTAAVTAAAPAACQDLSALGSSVSAIAAQIAAANPNSAKAQAVAAKTASGSAVTNADCQILAALAPLVNAGVQAGAAVAK